jgi:hypothetical protein
MRNFLTGQGFVLGLAVLALFCVTVVAMLVFSTPSTPGADKVHKTECLDGFEYYARTFRTYYGVGVALAPKWDRDGKPKRCSVEKEKP